jgi:hypothetical protein
MELHPTGLNRFANVLSELRTMESFSSSVSPSLCAHLGDTWAQSQSKFSCLVTLSVTGRTILMMHMISRRPNPTIIPGRKCYAAEPDRYSESDSDL